MSSLPLSFDRALGPAPTPSAGGAGSDRREAERAQLTDVAHQFEAALLLNLIRGMRRSMLDEEDRTGLGADTMTDTIDFELALQLSRSGGFGLADQVAGALDRAASGAETPAAGGPAMSDGLALAAPVAEGGEALEGVQAGQSAAGHGLGPLSSPFGMRWDPFGQGLKFHAGVDIAAAYGREVPAAGAGRVVAAGDAGSYGLSVVIEHEGGVRTRYAHLSDVQVTVGQQVAAGQAIGRVGRTGRSTGPHLHFEVLEDGRPVDPERAGLQADEALKSLGQVVDLSHE